MPKYHVDRSVNINADPDKVFAKIVDFTTWTTWSPWLISEPTAKVDISENSKSVGSTYAWKGEVTGQGVVEHKELAPGKHILEELRFIKPFKSVCTTQFWITPVPSGSKVQWTMDASMPWFLFFLIPMIRTMIGMDFQRGLNMLKEWIEDGKIRSKVNNLGKIECEAIRTTGVAARCNLSQIGDGIESAYAEAKRLYAKHGLPTSEPMITVYTKFDMKTADFDFIVGHVIPDGTALPNDPELKNWSIEAGKAYRVDHIGSYKHLGNAWSVANQWVQCKKHKQKKLGTYEIYRTSPSEEAEENLITEVYIPLKA